MLETTIGVGLRGAEAVSTALLGAGGGVALAGTRPVGPTEGPPVDGPAEPQPTATGAMAMTLTRRIDRDRISTLRLIGESCDPLAWV